jgi:hypothetical protein
MFGMPRGTFATIPSGAFTGDQVRGFGFLHDGSFDTVFDFLHANVFGFPGGDAQRRQVEDFVLAFDSTLAPIVGQQATLTATDLAVVGPRIDLMKQRAATAFDLVDVPGARECDLVVKDGGRRGAGMGLSARGRRLPSDPAPSHSRPRPRCVRSPPVVPP